MRTIERVLALALVTALVGCSVKGRPAEMVPRDMQAVTQHPQTVSLAVQGTEGNAITSVTLIDATDFERALTMAIDQQRVFSAVVPGRSGDLLLEVEAFATAPAAGLDMNVNVNGAWRLRKVSTGAVVLDEFVTASHRTTVGEAFVGRTRVRLAIEGAARKFIAEGLRRIGNAPRL
jgi:hypothetical protein